MNWRRCPDCKGKLYKKSYKDGRITVPFKVIDNDKLAAQIECKKCNRKLKYVTEDANIVKCGIQYLTYKHGDVIFGPGDELIDYEFCKSEIYDRFIWWTVSNCYKALVNGKALNKNEKIIVKGGI